jgi:hypothetical protein
MIPRLRCRKGGKLLPLLLPPLPLPLPLLLRGYFSQAFDSGHLSMEIMPLHMTEYDRDYEYEMRLICCQL